MIKAVMLMLLVSVLVLGYNAAYNGWELKRELTQRINNASVVCYECYSSLVTANWFIAIGSLFFVSSFLGILKVMGMRQL